MLSQKANITYKSTLTIFIIAVILFSSMMVFDIAARDEISDQTSNDNFNDNKKVFRIIQDENETTTTEEVDNTTVEELPSFRLPISGDLYYPLALVFSILGIFSVLWLVYFVETSKERTVRERVIGSGIRLIIMSITLGFAIHFWLLFGLI